MTTWNHVTAYVVTAAACIAAAQPAFGQGAPSDNDYVKISFIPSRGAFFKGVPGNDLQASTSSRHSNAEIRAFHSRIKAIADSGITDNATQFHQPIVYIETKVQGERVRVSFTGGGGQPKFADYERRWRALHGDVYRYLIREIAVVAP